MSDRERMHARSLRPHLVNPPILSTSLPSMYLHPCSLILSYLVLSYIFSLSHSRSSPRCSLRGSGAVSVETKEGGGDRPTSRYLRPPFLKVRISSRIVIMWPMHTIALSLSLMLPLPFSILSPRLASSHLISVVAATRIRFKLSPSKP